MQEPTNLTWLQTLKLKFQKEPTAGEPLLQAGAHHIKSETKQQPFPPQLDTSEYFRIPAIVTLQDGTLFAAADARYETTGDGGGLDTMFALSKDGGESWQQSYAIWYPDSERYAGKKATTCIDPVVAQGTDGTIYVLADMNPTGVTTMHGYTFPHVGTGYMTVEGKECLALTNQYRKVNQNPKENPYPYYLGAFDSNLATVYSTLDHEPTDWALDAWLNIYEKQADGKFLPLYQKQVNKPYAFIQQNAFYKGSVLHVYNTGFMLLVTSKDGGKTWQPQILNPQIKRPEEGALLVSPGKGTTLADGTIVLPFYNWYPKEKGLVQNASFIWSKDNGKTWHRTKDTHNGNGVDWFSENEIVEVHDGVLRMFIRNGTNKIAYVDATWDDSLQNYLWQDPTVTDIPVTSACNVTALTYSKEIDGKMAVMVAAPAGKGRANGKIFTFLLEADNTMHLAYTYAVNVGEYAYSCMDELPDGSIALLYEPKGGEIAYTHLSLETILQNKA